MPDLDRPPGMWFTEDWFSQHIPHLSILLEPWRNRPGLRMLEVGSFEGRSTVWFLQNLLTANDSRITCIDTFAGSEEHLIQRLQLDDLKARFLVNVSGYADKVEVMIGESGVVLRSIPPQEQYDIVYIDGSHRAPDVLEDAVLAWRLLKTNGMLIFDDYLWAEMPSRPGPAIDAFLDIFSDELEVVYKEYQIAVRKQAASGPTRHHD